MEPVYPSDSYVYFRLAGDFDPEVVAREIGLTPTESRAKHSIIPGKIPRCSHISFARRHGNASDFVFDMHDLAEVVIDELEPFQAQFADAIQKHDAHATLQVVCWLPGDEEASTPALGVSERVVRFLAAVGASIDIDCY